MVVNELAENDVATITVMKEPSVWLWNQAASSPYNILQTAIFINRLAPSDQYMGRTAQLTSRHCNLNTYSTNKCTEYFKLAA
jgi:hypothetical protein